MIKFQNIVAMALCLLTGLLAYPRVVSAQNDATATVDRSAFANPNIRYLGQQIPVYKGRAGNNKVFFYAPYIKPDREKFREDINKKCHVSPDTKPISIRLDIEFTNEEFRKQIVEAIPDIERTSQLLPLPYRFIHLEMAGRTILQRPAISLLEGVRGRPSDIALRSNEQPKISINCGFAKSVLESDTLDMSGYVIRDLTAVKSDTVTIGLEAFKKTQGYQDLQREERQSGTKGVRVSSVVSENGGRISTPILSIGGGTIRQSSNTEQYDNQRRWIHGGLIQNMVEEARTQLTINRNVWENTTTETDISLMLDRLLAKVFSIATEVELSFAKRADGQWEVSDGQFERTINQDDVDEIVKSAQQYLGAEANQNSVTVPGDVSATNSNATKTANRSQISFKKEGTHWVPTNATMYVLNSADLDNAISVSASENILSSDGLAQYDMLPFNPKSAKEYDLSFEFENEIERLESMIDATTEENLPTYIVEAKFLKAGIEAEIVNDVELLRRCGDKDHCLIYFGLKGWNGGKKDSDAEGAIAFTAPITFMIDPKTRVWRIGSGYSGIDGDGRRLHNGSDAPHVWAMGKWGCYLSEDLYTQKKYGGDNKIGFALLANEAGYANFGKTCLMYVRD